MLDITMTAVRRPDIVKRTLESFKENMFGSYDSWLMRLIINIDPVGGTEEDEKEIISYVKATFHETVINTPDRPSFPKAFKWCWLATTARYVFHLEDDWELVKPISIVELVHTLHDNPYLALIRLPSFKAVKGTMKNWNKFFPYDSNGYYKCPQELRREVGFCGHPSLIKGEFVRAIAPYLDTNRNPEKQFHRGPLAIMTTIDKYDYAVHGDYNSDPYILDIGRKWLVDKPWRKKGNKAHFVEWECTNQKD